MNAIAQQATGAKAAIRPFHMRFSNLDLDDLRRRVMGTRFPEKEIEPSPQGLRLTTILNLARYWATGYDWRKVEAKLNSYPQFVTAIDGVDIHFIHVRSKHENALPVIITHGWPGSIVEQLKIIEPLIDPTAHGGSESDAFHVVIPSRPGCSYSGKPTTPGWDCPRIAQAWAVLMERLGYARYVAQGGDWGAFVTEQMGAQAPAGLLGIHTNLPSAVPGEIFQAMQAGKAPANLGADEQRAFAKLSSFLAGSLSYAQQMATHPHSLYGIADSPVGLATWYLDNDLWTPGVIASAVDGNPDSLTRDDLLDNISIAWLTNTAISSTRLYRENKLAFFAPMGIEIPVAVSAFPDEIYQVPRSWAERAYPKLVHYNKVAKGGHFAAWEQPELFAAELRAGFRSLRNAANS